MVNRLQTAFQEERRHLRVAENSPAAWRVSQKEAIHEGRIRNVSASGMLLEADPSLAPAEGEVLSFETGRQQPDFVPPSGEVVWRRDKHFLKKKSLCGIRFADVPEASLLRLRQRVQEGIKHQAALRRFYSLLSLLCAAVAAALTGYMLYLGFSVYQEVNASNQQMMKTSTQQAFLTRNYQELYHQTSRRLDQTTGELGMMTRLYQESQGMLRSAAQELESVKAALAQTEVMLALAQQENLNLHQERETVGSLRRRDVQLTGQTDDLRDQLDRWESNFYSIQDGKALTAFYHDRIRQVKAKIREIKRQARAVKIAALQERDRIRSVLGNNGYFIRDGQIVEVDFEKYEGESLQASSIPESSSSFQKVRVDVNVFP